VILEVCLNVFVGVVADDLDGVLVGANSTVAAETPEFAGDRAFRSCVVCDSLWQGQIGDIVDDADGEAVLGLVCRKVFKYGKYRGRRSILGAKAIASADDLGVYASGGKSCDYIEVQRLAQCTGFLGAVENSDLFDRCRNGLDELVSAERTI